MLVVLSTLPVAFAGVLGAVLASFLCVVAERVPARVGLTGRSRCVCGRPVPPARNIPVVGWLTAGGVARCCGAKLPVRYLAAEAGLAGWFALVAATLPGLGWQLAAAGAGCGCVVAGCWRPPSRPR